MESHEVLEKAVSRVGAKKVARELKVSHSLVYKWCQPQGLAGSGGSGARNPLDRVRALVESTGDRDVLEWLCQRARGFFVRDPETTGRPLDAEYIANTQRIIEDFSKLLRVVSDAIADDGKVDRREAEKIRTEWQRLKQYGEAFVCACEQGLFAKT